MVVNKVRDIRSRNASPEFLPPVSHAGSTFEMLFKKGPLAVPPRALFMRAEKAPSRFHSQKNETAHSLLTHTDLNSCSCLAIPLFPLLPFLSPSVRCVIACVVDQRSALVKTRPSRALKGASALLAFASIFHRPRPTPFLVPYLP